MARTPDITRLQDKVLRAGDVLRGEDGSAPASILVRGGEDSSAVTNGASAEFRAGDGLVGVADGGPATFRGGDGDSGGLAAFRAGDGSVALGAPAEFRAGDGATSGGAATFRSGDGVTGLGGPVTLRAGDGTSGGALTIDSGIGSTGLGGPLSITTGGGPAGAGALALLTGDGSSGGPITIIAGNGVSAGGPIGITGGDDTGTSGGGGTVTIGGGNVTLGTAIGDGGSVLLVKGTAAGTGSDGSIVIDGLTWPAADGTVSQVLTTNGAGALSWATVAGTGDVVGPSISVDDRIAAFDGITGKLIKESTVTATAVASHLTDTANPHSTSVANIGSGTLAQLNTAVTDATLDDSSASRPPSGSASGDLGGSYPSPTVNDGADGTAIHDNVSAEISAITAKAAPVEADFLVIEDSAASNAKKSITIGTFVTIRSTALGIGNFTLSAGWGTTASVSSISGTDSRFLIEVTPTGAGLATGPTITLTYADGAWSTAPVPMITDNGSIDGAGGFFAPAFELTSRTTTTAVWTLRNAITAGSAAHTPVSGEIYKMIVHVLR